jgi:hypothetical protein
MVMPALLCFDRAVREGADSEEAGMDTNRFLCDAAGVGSVRASPRTGASEAPVAHRPVVHYGFSEEGSWLSRLRASPLVLIDWRASR